MASLTRARVAAVLAFVLVAGAIVALGALPAPAPASSPARPSSTPVPPPAPAPPTAAPRAPESTAAPTPVIGGALVYVRDGELVLTGASGGTTARLTFDVDRKSDPALSPDGRSLVFTAQRAANWDLYQLDLLDGRVTRLTDDADYDGRPAISPDGREIAFETTREGDLDIYLLPAGGKARPLVNSPAAETAPAWSPDGRWVVYSAQAGGQRDLYVVPAAGGEPVNLTRSAQAHEDEPAVSPDGRRLAYSVGLGGERVLYVAPVDLAAGRLITAEARLIGYGASPAWSPDGASLAYLVPARRAPRVEIRAVAAPGTVLRAYPAEALGGPVAWGRSDAPDVPWARELAATSTPEPPPLYVEETAPRAMAPPYYQFVKLPVLTGGPYLSDRVDDSFRALRRRVVDETGFDYLRVFGDMWRAIDGYARPGQSDKSWHKAGRAFDIDQGPCASPKDVAVVQETYGGQIFWRVYFRTARQDGSRGEPIRVATWDFAAQRDYAGGAVDSRLPSGYWLDFTRLAAEYGWTSVGALNRWRSYYADADWWHFQKTDGLGWFEAMREVYTDDEIRAVFGPDPTRPGGAGTLP